MVRKCHVALHASYEANPTRRINFKVSALMLSKFRHNTARQIQNSKLSPNVHPLSSAAYLNCPILMYVRPCIMYELTRGTNLMQQL